MLVDTHCHFNTFSPGQREELISFFPENYYLVDSSTNYESSLASIVLSSQHSFIYTSLGFHPFWGKEFTPGVVENYRKLIREKEAIVAIGEIGLDYKAPISIEEQEVILREFIELAQETSLPLIIHHRLDSSPIFDILDDFFPSYEKIIFHCFSYSKEFLKKIVNKGGYASFSLNILRRKEEIVASLKACPLDSLFLETDSPYMRIKSKPSTPFDVKQVYSHAAYIKEVEAQELEKKVFLNAQRVFGLK